MNELQIVTGGAGDDEIKIYTGRADSRARSGGEFPSGNPDFQRRDGKHVRDRGNDNRGNRKNFRRENASISFFDAIFDALNIGAAGRWWLMLAARYLFVILAFVIYTAVISHNAAQKARAETAQLSEAQFQQYIQEQEAAAEAARIAAEADKRNEAEMIAQMLYGVKDNSNADLRTLVWCVFNRVDNARFPSTIEGVITQEGQWMGYGANNPILEDLYQIAVEEMDVWRNGAHRPVSSDYVYMSWSPSSITLRDNFTEAGSTHYWRYK